MMSRGSDKASSGDPFRVPRSWNDMVDAGQDYALRRRLGFATWNPQPQHASPGIIMLKNESGQDCDVGDILAVTDVVVELADFNGASPNLLEWTNNMVWSGTKPSTSTDVGKFAVLIDPIEDDGFGRAVADGIVAAQITIDSADYHFYADIANNSVRLTSNFYGAAEILYTETVAATDYALVRVGRFEAPSYPGKLNATLNYGSSASVSIWKYDSGWGDTGKDVTAYDWLLSSGQSIASGTKVDVQFNQLLNIWRVLNAECPP